MKKGKSFLKSKLFVLLLVVILVAIVISVMVLNSKNTVTQAESGITDNKESGNVDPANWDTTKVNIVYDTDNVAVPVPIGYTASSADGEHTVSTGFVIYEGEGEVTTDNAWEESKNRNQWVWVPVSDPSRIYETDSSGKLKSKLYDYPSTGTERVAYSNDNNEPWVSNKMTDWSRLTYNLQMYELQGTSRNELLHEFQIEYNATIESIKKYGGFYIGRYETGNLSEKVPVVQRMNTDISNQNWYTIYNKMEYLAANDNVKTNIIWGNLWDETLQWFIDVNAKTYQEIRGTGNYFGNYYGRKISYTTTDKEHTITKYQDTLMISTGSSEDCKANNIYDMAGNVWEMTLESSEYYGNDIYVMRGGSYKSYGNQCPVSKRSVAYSDYEATGVRAYLYIK